MYYPYLRGKLYELLALPSLCTSVWNSSTIAAHPVIEPVRVDTDTLKRCTLALREAGIGFSLIVNPGVGDLADNPASQELLTCLSPEGPNLFADDGAAAHFALIVDKHHELGQLARLQEEIRQASHQQHPCTLIFRGLPHGADQVQDVVQRLNPHTVIFDTIREARHVEGVKRASRTVRRVRLDDPFPKHDRNSDYPDEQPQRFTEEHQYFREDRWDGFGDYLTIGRVFSDSGYTPRAVAIHWTYVDETAKYVMVEHFVSADQQGLADVPGKFLQAADKLVAKLTSATNPINDTEGLRQMQELAGGGHFPGLGTIKKLSMMNHLEIMASLAQENTHDANQ